jgi:hypothetical protein
MNPATAARVEANRGLLADRIEEEALLNYPFPSEEIAEAIGQGNAVRRLAAPFPSDRAQEDAVLAVIREWNGIATYPDSEVPSQRLLHAVCVRLLGRGQVTAEIRRGQTLWTAVAPATREV